MVAIDESTRRGYPTFAKGMHGLVRDGFCGPAHTGNAPRSVTGRFHQVDGRVGVGVCSLCYSRVRGNKCKPAYAYNTGQFYEYG